MHVAVANLNCASVDSVLVCYTAVFSGVTQRSAPEFPGMWFGSQSAVSLTTRRVCQT